jgi:probable rRNA maturation factor
MTRGRRKPNAPSIDIVVACPRWKARRGVAALLRRAIAEAAMVSTRRGELAIVLADDSKIRALNKTWRGKDTPTNVLSFPAKQHGAPHLLGDIVLAYETLAREAKAERKPFAHHLAHLAVHGYLHLVGFDHEEDDDAFAMEGAEIAILARLKVPNPYVARRRKG